MSLILTDAEIVEITGLTQGAAQQRWFKQNLGIDAKRRADGKLSVPRSLYLQKSGIATQEKRAPQLRLVNAT